MQRGVEQRVRTFFSFSSCDFLPKCTKEEIEAWGQKGTLAGTGRTQALPLALCRTMLLRPVIAQLLFSERKANFI